jgi:AAA domain/Bifunctional DNA primase/polymerase, N-terminal
MIGSMDWFGTIFGAVPDGGIGYNAKVAKAMIRAGLAVVLIEPGGKRPVCTLAAREVAKADREAQDAARAAGAANWERVRHACGIYHAITQEPELTRKRIKELLASECNLAVAPGAGTTRIVIIDVDTANERTAFLADWYGATDRLDGLGAMPLTVASPGSKGLGPDGAEVWAHRDGGHFWLELTEGQELPQATIGKYKDPHGWAAYWGTGYVLVPPSVRAEGAYRVTGQIHPCPDWVLQRLADASAPRPRGDGWTGEGTDPIDAWSATTPWEELLVPDGYTPYGLDACGCPTWTRPGSPAHAKSATAHEDGCTRFDTSAGHGPLHLWSDNATVGAEGADAATLERTLTKLGYVTAARHGGDTSAAMLALGLERALPADLSVGEADTLDADLALEVSGPKAPAVAGSSGDGLLSDPAPADPAESVEATESTVSRFAPLDWIDLFTGDPQPARFLPASLLETGQQISLVGEGKSGKSLLMFEWCWHAITGTAFLDDVRADPVKVLYVDAENSRNDLLARARAIGANPEVLAEYLIYLSFPPFKPLDSSDGAAQLLEIVDHYRPGVVVLDTVSRFVAGGENDSDTWLALYRKVHRALKGAEIACIRLDHFGKDTERGARGNSAKSQDIDHVWELTVGNEDVSSGEGVIDISTALTLRRTHTRTGLGPDQISIRRSGRMTQARDMWIPGATVHSLSSAADPFAVTLDRPEAVMREVVAWLEANPGVSQAAVLEAVRGRRERVRLALELLVREGRVEASRGERGRISYRSVAGMSELGPGLEETSETGQEDPPGV